MKISLVTTTLDHIQELSKTLRDQDKQECLRLGFEPEKALYYSFKHAVIKRTGLINGKVAAIWGVTGTPLGITGQPYLVTSNEILKISPFKFARFYRKEVQAFNIIFPILENYVDASYIGAIRMLKVAGFKINTTDPFITETGKFFKFTLK